MKDYLNYAKKNVVVTGGASGMGEATAKMLVELGAVVYVLDWAEPKIEGIEKYIHVDLSQQDSIDHAMEQLPEHIDSFFGIAGVSGSKNDFITTVKIDLISNKYICEKYLSKRMTTGGSIAFMTSTAGNDWNKDENKSVYLPVLNAKGWDETISALQQTNLTRLPGTLGYPFSKLAMNYLTIQLQKQFASKGIRVNAILPGSTDTGMKDEFEQMAGGQEALLSHCGYAKRLALSKEMAGPIVFINSDMASYISGELLVVDYGQSAEEKAGIKEIETTISLQAIINQMMQR